MRGSVRIYVNKKDREIYLLKEYKTKIGYWNVMGYLTQTGRESLKKEILVCIRDSISAYQQEIEPTEPFKSSPYKTWNKFFKYHDSISCEYDSQMEEYRIAMNTREEKTHSYSSPASGFEFILTKEEFNENFDKIIDFLISNVKMIK
ncbi:hypothetical protein [Selenomonas noxia]|jgi:hypothetical protein|uniref:hypothetical protein n=1 Tax=Selenomonas noxia TaxID=135083 RepID=UPI0028D222FF|nr:hypothetical protein [Selenomonas noxia]